MAKQLITNLDSLIDGIVTENVNVQIANQAVIDAEAAAGEAANSEIDAAGNANAAAISADEASASADEAVAQVALAELQVALATDKAEEAAVFAAAADESQALAAKYRAAALEYLAATNAKYDEFDDRYLGALPSDPRTDNDGNALLEGAIYWNMIEKILKIYTGVGWIDLKDALTGYLSIGNNLSEISEIDGDKTFNDNVIITGDLTVNGTTTTVNSTTVTTADNIVVLNNGEVGAGVTAGSSGLEIDRGSESNYQMIFDEATDTFRAGEVGSTQALATREDAPVDTGVAVWDAATNKLVTTRAINVDSLQFSGGIGTQGLLSWNVDEETVDMITDGSTTQLGQEVLVNVRNSTGAQINNGVPVMFTGTLGASSRILVAPMDGTSAENAKYFVGVATQDIPAGEDGKVTFFGKIREVNTTGSLYGETWVEGDLIYVSPTTVGALTNVEPTNDQLKMPIAAVISSTNNGTLFCRALPVNYNEFADEIYYDNTTSALIATDVQSAIDEVEGRVGTLESDINTEGSVLNTVRETAANATYDNTTSGLTATTLESAINELDSRVDKSEEVRKDTNEPTGFIREFPDTMGIIEFSPDGTNIYQIDQNGAFSSRSDGLFASGTVWEEAATARTFAVYPVASQGSYNVYVEGMKFTITTLQKQTFTDVSGLKFIYHDENGVLQIDTTFAYDYFEDNAITSTVYWNATHQLVVNFGDERHGIQMDGFTHRYLHFTGGTKYISGMEVQGLTSGGSTYTQVTSGEAYDEDIFMTPGQQSTLPHLYINGTEWDYDLVDNSIALMDTGVAQYNQDTGGGVYQLTPLSSGEFTVTYFCLTNNKQYPYACIAGQTVYATLADARADIETVINNLKLTGLPSPEFLPIAAVMVNDLGEVQTLNDGSLYVDLRTAKLSGVGTTSVQSTTHADLLSRDATNSHPGSAISYDNTISELLAINVQDAVDEVEGRLDTAETKLSGIEDGATADQIASEVPVTSTGNLAANNVQAGLEELQGDIDNINGGSLDSRYYTETEVDALLAAQDEAGEIAYDNTTSGLTATDVQAAIDEFYLAVGTVTDFEGTLV